MKILVPTAGARAARGITDYLIKIAATLNAELVALHALTEGEPQVVGEDAVGGVVEAGKQTSVPVKTVVKSGSPVSTIIEMAEEESVQLIVMGASRGKIVEEWLSADVLGRTAIPVVVNPHGLT